MWRGLLFFVGDAVNEINEEWQHISHTQVVRTWHTDRLGLVVHQFQDWWTLAQGVPGVPKFTTV